MSTNDGTQEEEDRIERLSEEEFEALMRKLRKFDLRHGEEEDKWRRLGKTSRRKRNPLLPA